MASENLCLVSNDKPRQRRRGRLLAREMGPVELAQWQTDCGYRSHAAAAEAMGIHVQQYRAMLAGRSPIPRCAEILCWHVQIHHVWVLDRTLAALVGLLRAHIPLPPPIYDRVHQIITEVIKPISSDK